MTVTGKGADAHVTISITGHDGVETSVKAMFSDDLLRTFEGLVAKN